LCTTTQNCIEKHPQKASVIFKDVSMGQTDGSGKNTMALGAGLLHLQLIAKYGMI